MPSPSPEKAPEEAPPKLEISLVQVLAAALASITTAVILSKFGVAGTYVGTAVGSALSTVGVAVYSHTMRQARRRAWRYAQHHLRTSDGRLLERRVLKAPAVRVPPAAWSAHHPRPVVPRTVHPVVVGRPGGRRRGWRGRLDRLERWFAELPLAGKAVVTAVTAFVFAVAAVVLFQFLSGHSLTNVWGIGSSSRGPNVGCVIGRCGPSPAPLLTTVPTPTTTPQPTSRPTNQPTPAPSVRPTVGASPAAGPTAAPPTPPPSVAPSPLATTGP